jgi:hypothetical protein
LVLGITILDRQVLALDIAGFLKALEERSDFDLVVNSGLREEHPDHRHRRLLRPRAKGPRRRTPEPRDELPPSHP